MADVQAFKDLAKQKEGSTSAPDEFLGGEGGGVSIYHQSSTKKKWTATPTDVNRRPDDFLGASPGTVRRSWRPKSEVGAGTPTSETVEHVQPKSLSTREATDTVGKASPSVAEMRTWSSNRELNTTSNHSVGGIGSVSHHSPRKDDEKSASNDHDAVHAFKILAKQKEGDVSRPNEFLHAGGGVSIYHQSPTRKKWSPKPTDVNRRPDDFLGGCSPGKAHRSWRPKSEVHASETSDNVSSSAAPWVTHKTTETSGLPKFSHLEKDSTHQAEPVVVQDEPLATPEVTEKKEIEPKEDDSGKNNDHDAVHAFKILAKQKEGDVSRPNDFVHGDGGGVSIYHQSPTRKKWSPKPTDVNRRPDDFLGAPPGKAHRSWKPKSDVEVNPQSS